LVYFLYSNRLAKSAKLKLQKEEAEREAAEMLAKFSSSQVETTEGSEALTVPTELEPSEEETANLDAPTTVDDVDGEDPAEDDEDHEHDEAEDADEEDEGGDEEGGEEEAEVEEEVAPVAEEQEEGPSAEELAELSEAERERLELLAEEEAARMQSAGQRRMKEFLDKVQESVRRHASHPRRMPRNFFMPMVFSEDIYFDPFATIDPDVLGDGEEVPLPAAEIVSSADLVDLEPPHPVDPFADVNVKLSAFRNEEERKRKLLFATTLQEVPATDWIRVFRTYTVDWDSFFASQDAMVELSAAVKESDMEIDEYFNNNDPLKKITDTLAVSPSPRSTMGSRTNSHISMSSSGYFSGTATPEEDGAPTVTLLPFGKILEHQKVKQGDYRYFKLQHFKQSAMLTVEVQCVKGLVDVYLAHQKLPSLSMHERHVACTKANKGVVRLAFRPNKSGTFFVAVRSHETDAKFNIWTYSSSAETDRNPIIARVNSILRKFEILSMVDETLLLELYPKYEKEAAEQVRAEEAEKASAVEAKLRAAPLESYFGGDDDDSINELYDIESVGAFIARVAKYTLTGDEEAALYGEELPEEPDDVFQEYGQVADEADDSFTPLLSAAPSVSDLLPQQPGSPERYDSSLPPIARGYSMSSLNQDRKENGLDSSHLGEGSKSSVQLPGIKGASSAISSSYSTKRSVPRSKASINVAREYAALDHALSTALRKVPEKKVRVENPLLHQTLKPVKYQLRGDFPI
jgi:hypothetical protein